MSGDYYAAKMDDLHELDHKRETHEQIKERPILFSGEMVRAILDGRKTQTRRIVKPQPPSYVHEIRVGMYEPVVIRKGMEEPGIPVFGFANEEQGRKCPFGQPGDRLWVRESWAVVPRVTDNGPKHKAKGDGTGATWKADWNGNPSGFKWKPSIHMPRWASRITLEITGVRVERLNDISEEDARSEGLEDRAWMGPSQITLKDGKTVHGQSVYCFKALWESINGKGSWDANPWVWVIEFKRLETSE